MMSSPSSGAFVTGDTMPCPDWLSTTRMYDWTTAVLTASRSHSDTAISRIHTIPSFRSRRRT
jgi:hypothetical protein